MSWFRYTLRRYTAGTWEAQSPNVARKIFRGLWGDVRLFIQTGTLHSIEEAAMAQFHTVVSGDSLSKIAKEFYGDAMKYPVIFEANKPMLTHPDKIYPGQVLRIPPLVD